MKQWEAFFKRYQLISRITKLMTFLAIAFVLICLVCCMVYSELSAAEDSAPLEIRVEGALRTILSIYNVPKEIRDEKIKKVLSMNYQKLGLDTLTKFREYVDQTTEQALFDLLKRKQIAQ